MLAEADAVRIAARRLGLHPLFYKYMKFSYYNSGITQTVPDKAIDIKEAAKLIKDHLINTSAVQVCKKCKLNRSVYRKPAKFQYNRTNRLDPVNLYKQNLFHRNDKPCEVLLQSPP